MQKHKHEKKMNKHTETKAAGAENRVAPFRRSPGEGANTTHNSHTSQHCLKPFTDIPHGLSVLQWWQKWTCEGGIQN
ncbi:unnamed protein product [Arctogadus glacialis]